MRTTVPAVDNARLLSALPAACMLSHPLVASDALGGCALQDLKILPRSSAFAVRWPRSRVARGALWSAHSTGSCYGICGVLAFPSVRDPSLLCFCMCGLPKVLTHAVYTCERHVGPKLLVHEVHVGIPEKGFQDRHGPWMRRAIVSHPKSRRSHAMRWADAMGPWVPSGDVSFECGR